MNQIPPTMSYDDKISSLLKERDEPQSIISGVCSPFGGYVSMSLASMSCRIDEIIDGIVKLNQRGQS